MVARFAWQLTCRRSVAVVVHVRRSSQRLANEKCMVSL
ncbi:hypothetical protein XCR_0645 [Xanthomonas campestris pv. raphani 756C]|nr:hypothetical protein XCR_0645 [Xanthomonas campestris pv. raphani 756C]